MASEIRVNKINNRAGLGTVTYTDTGIIVSGIVTALAAKVSVSTQPSGSPPTANPVIVPSPLIVTGISLITRQYLYDSPRTS